MNPNPLLTVAIHASKEAGREILNLYTMTAFEMKSDGSPVTKADLRSNEVLMRHLKETNIPVLSEETLRIETPYPERIWIVDPLDGTRDFIKKNGNFCVMIGLLEHGSPVLGVVYVPATDTIYYAEKGKGAHAVKKGKTTPLKVSSRENSDLKFLSSRNVSFPEMEAVKQELDAETIFCGSVGVKAALLGEGTGDYFFYLGKLGEWDICAPEIITKEAGGTVTDRDGKKVEYGSPDHRFQNGVVFSNTACHERVLQAITKTVPKKEL